MGIGSTVFNAQWESWAEARCFIRVARRKTIDRCLCGSFSTTRTATDEGTYDAAMASVKVKRADWPRGEKMEGAVVEFIRASGDEWKPFRVSAVSETDGIVSLILEAEFA